MGGGGSPRRAPAGVLRGWEWWLPVGRTGDFLGDDNSDGRARALCFRGRPMLTHPVGRVTVAF